jgi:hypothetical protein
MSQGSFHARQTALRSGVPDLQAASRQKGGGRSCEQPRPAQGWLPNTSHLREWHPPTSPNSPINRMDADTAHLAYSFCTRPGMVITPTGRRYRAAHVPNLAEPTCLPSTSRCWSGSSSPDPTVVIGAIYASEAVCPMCRGTNKYLQHRLTGCRGLVPEGAKPTIWREISLQICLTVGETGKRILNPFASARL